MDLGEAIGIANQNSTYLRQILTQEEDKTLARINTIGLEQAFQEIIDTVRGIPN